jgi:hypothetical protein
MSTDLEELQLAVRTAFGLGRPPDFDHIASHECDECRAVREAFAGWKWESLPGEIIRENHDKLPLFDAEAFVYYLPAYLLYALGHWDPDDPVTEFTTYQLTPNCDPEDAERCDYHRSRLRHLTEEQFEVCHRFTAMVLADKRFQHYEGVEERRRQFADLWSSRWD